MRIDTVAMPLRITALAWLASGALGGVCLATPNTPPAAPSAPVVDPSASPSPADAVEATPDAPEDDGEERGRRRRRHGGDTVRFGESYSLPAGEVHDKDIVVFGGSVDIAGRQNGDVVVFGGGAQISGEVNGDVVLFGGGARLAPTARVDGDVVTMGGALHKEPGAVLRGEKVQLPGAKIAAGLAPIGLTLGSIGFGLSILSAIAKASLALLIGLVIVALLPAHVEAAGSVLRERWPASIGVGFLAFLACFPLTVILLITCVGAVLPFLFYQIAKYFGLTVLFIVIGQALGRSATQRELGPMASLLVGFLVLTLIGFVVGPIWFVYGWLGVGLAILTRFGTLKPWLKKRGPESPALPPAAPSAPVE
jgi:hypothetical protein